jgi:3-isopropylmalate/(R)-2-methylmalate dehydratase small subunit
LIGGGFRAVVSTDFADIFRNNALKNGLLPIIVDEETRQQLVSLAEEDPSTEITIDLSVQSLTLPDGRSVEFPIDGFSKHCLLNGVDQLGFLLGLDEQIAQYEVEYLQHVQTAS